MPNVSDNNFDQHFRDHLGTLSSTPSDRNWMAIEQQLPQVERRKLSWWWVWPAILLVGFTAGAFWYLDALEERKEWQALQLTPSASFNAAVKMDLLVMTRIMSRQPQLTGEQRPASIPPVAVVPGWETTAARAGNATPVSMELADNRVLTTESLLFYLDPIQASLLDTRPFTRNPLFYESNGKLRQYAPAGLRIGPMAMAHLTGLRGDAVLQPYADNQYEAVSTGGTAYGLAVHYDFSSRWGITLETHISSSEGQQFAYVPVANTLVPEQLSYQVATNYLRIPLLAKYRGEMWRSLSPNPILWNIQAGVVYGRLNWVNLDNAGQLVMPRAINSHELGMSLGASADWYVGKNYVWTVGARLTSSYPMSHNQANQSTSGSWQGGIYTQFSWLLSNQQR